MRMKRSHWLPAFQGVSRHMTADEQRCANCFHGAPHVARARVGPCLGPHGQTRTRLTVRTVHYSRPLVTLLALVLRLADVHHSRPKPSAFMMASLRRFSILSRDAYSGSSSVLKHVWLVGSLSESGPSRWMTHFMFPRPPIGARSEPARMAVVRDVSSGAAAVGCQRRDSPRTPPGPPRSTEALAVQLCVDEAPPYRKGRGGGGRVDNQQ